VTRSRDHPLMVRKCENTRTESHGAHHRVVTRPDVEKCLVLWVKHMEEVKGKTVTSPMLIAKREKFEKQLNVAEEEQLKRDGWLFRFCKTYVLSLI
jgi:hypothetical protein